MNIEELAKKAVNNWEKFDSFGWHEQPEDAENFCIVYTNNRDSGILEQSNASVIQKELEEFMEGDDPDVYSEHHGHFLCGWVDGYAIRVYKNGEVTDAFKKWCEIHENLENYPVLDDEDYSRREYEATLNNMKSEFGKYFKGNKEQEESVAQELFNYFWETDQSQVENRDDQGGCPTKEAIFEALFNLDLFDPDYEDELTEWLSEKVMKAENGIIPHMRKENDGVLPEKVNNQTIYYIDRLNRKVCGKCANDWTNLYVELDNFDVVLCDSQVYDKGLNFTDCDYCGKSFSD